MKKINKSLSFLELSKALTTFHTITIKLMEFPINMMTFKIQSISKNTGAQMKTINQKDREYSK